MMIESSLRLFKALPLDKKEYSYDNSDILKRTLGNGYIFSPEIFEHFPKSRMNDICSMVEKELVLKAEEMNNTFHKSWNKVKTAPYIQLVLEQVFHYITTYGYESIGAYDEDLVYIPNEKLKIPDLKDDIPLMVIKGYTASELKDKLIKILSSGIALAEDTISDVVEIMQFVEIDDLSVVKNKEIRMFLHERLNKIPSEPIEFLRYLIYRSIGKTLLIKDKATIEAIKTSSINLSGLFDMYEKEHSLSQIATIFYRFKPLFLAMRNGKMKPVINRIRRLATTYHKPMREDYLNTVTKQIKDGSLDLDALEKALTKVNVFRKIRLAYALKYRMAADVDSIVYKIRNGRGYADKFSFRSTPLLYNAFNIIVDSIVDNMAKNVDGKKIYIPENINYTLPSTEKQFTGNFPSGTSIVIPKDLIFGIHWNNNRNYRVDLDLSLVTSGDKFGWDSSYRSSDGEILFSGDITDAKGKNGATELFYVKKQAVENYLVYLNYFNYNQKEVVPFKIIAARRELQSLKSNYMIDPNNVIAVAASKMDKKSKILGIVSTTTKECKFYFSETYIGNSITSRSSKQTEQSKSYLVNFYKNSINLKDILEKAGAVIVHEKDEIDIDLSIDSLEKDTILNLLI